MRSIHKFWLAFAVSTALATAAVYAEQSLTTKTSSPSQQVDPTSLRDQLVDLEKQSWVAWKNRNGQFFESFLSDDHVEISPSGRANKTTVVAGVSSPACVVKSYSVDSFQFTLFGANTALLNYHAEQDTRCDGVAVPSPAWVSSLYVKRGDHWLNALYQQSPAAKR